MLQIRRRQINRQATGVSRPLPPPVNGWNAKDSLDGMKPYDAVILENWFPRQSDVITRKGYTEHCDTGEGTGKHVKTLAEWKAGGSRKLIAGCNGKLINVTTSTPSTLGTGFTVDRWRWANFGERVFFVNGTNAPQDYDGTTLSATAWSGSGLTIANLSDVCVFKERLFFIEKNTLNVWYAALQAVTGTLTKFPLKYSGTFGGTLVSIGTLAIDGGSGADDLILFYLSSGEVIVYQGSDPAVAADWSRVGTFFIAPPMTNPAPLLQYGSDLVAITHGAYTPITKVMAYGRTQPSQLDLSDQISGAVVQASDSYHDNEGWQGVHFPTGRKLIVNVPRSTTAFDQHVMNIDTRRWCKFTGWNFPVFGLFEDDLYAGDCNGVVHQCDTGTSDNGDAIVVDAQTAWNNFGAPNQLKNFTEMRVIFAAISDPGAVMTFGTDFVISIPTSSIATAAVTSGGIWDQAIWDQDIWAGATQAIQSWQGINGEGYWGSMRLRVSLTSQQVSWMAGNVVMKPGAMV